MMIKNLSLISAFIFISAKLFSFSPTLKQHSKILQTGWYYISEQKNGYPRQLDKSTEVIYLDPKPILTAKQIENTELKQVGKEKYLLMKLNASGTKAWADATGASIGRKLAFVIKDRLIYTPQVNAQITSGLTALNSGIYDDVALDAFKKQIVSEMH